MASYRFCRPDDIPYLVRAVEACWRVHFPDEPTMTVERFRDEMKHLDVWPSNSMVASSDAGPLAVMIGTKRIREVRILRLGVHPDHRRQGHGLHLLDSLSHKLAVLGPPRLIVELPEHLEHLAPFLAAAGYRHETTFRDVERPGDPAAPVPAEWLQPMAVQAAIAWIEEQRDPARPVAWDRQPETLASHAEALHGVAFASPERIEACALWRPARDSDTDRVGDDSSRPREVVALAAGPGPDAAKLLGLLLRHLASSGATLRLPRLADGEVPDEVLAAYGFRATGRHQLWAAEAVPA